MNTEKPALPPTGPRLRLALDLKRRRLKCWHFLGGPEIRRVYDDKKVTDEVLTFVAAGYADLGEVDPELKTSQPLLTPAGEEWLQTYGGTE